MKNVALIIRDGWGINNDDKYNAIKNAKTPNIDAMLQKYPNTVLECSGLSVGLPAGYQGSSEVGHLNMGAGRIVKQELLRINEAIGNGEFQNNENFQSAIRNCKEKGTSLHVMGLVQDEGVHSHCDHLFAIMKYAAEAKVPRLYIHFFADGRDTPPRSSLQYLDELESKISEYGIGQITTVMGRYYSMDRGQIWPLTFQAYKALVDAKGESADSAREAIEKAYSEFKTPDGDEMTDEYIPPYIIGNFTGIKDGDSVIHFNYRQDRAIQLTQMFVEDECPVPERRKLNIVYCGLTRYYDSFPNYILGPMDATMHNLLGEIISRQNMKQLRIAETQKFKHVTSFFNGKTIEPYAGEDRIEIKGSFDPATFGSHPEMNAYDVKNEVIRQIKTGKYDFIAVNFANCDMVGHTGDFEAATKAVEVVDECVGEVVASVLEQNGMAMITADHGNAEEMMDFEMDSVKTSHTTNPVELIYVANDCDGIELRSRGILADIAPTILYLLRIDQPAEMTAENLIVV